jgi:cytosol alanyl aminopeptidase
MKRLFKWTGILLTSVIIIYFAKSGLDKWQAHRDAQAIIGTPQGQLPDWATPIDYDLKLTINPSKTEFSGEVLIQVKLSKSTDKVWLHGKDFVVDNSQWQDQNGIWHTAVFQEVGHSGVVRYQLGKTIEPQTIGIKINFKREFSTELNGLYRVVRKDGADIFTQFEATDARKAFPSFDEPRFKTPFKFQLTVPSKASAFTSTSEIERQVVGQNTQIQFARSKPMPTYLVAFAVGDFDVVDGGMIPPNIYRDYPIPFRAIAGKGKGEKLSYAIGKTQSILVALEEYFGRAYPYEKLDIIAIPDFAAGAMENVGLITYREQLLLLGDDPSISQQDSFYRVHAHELAHQWFGNLVTMPWWDDLWLNESFASWMESKIVTQLRPDLRSIDSDIQSVHNVMIQDGLVAARQIREPINTNGDIANAFDGITYTKGGGVLHMFEQFIGEDDFRRGVQHHIKRFEWGNATAPDLMDSIAQVTQDKLLVDSFLSFLEQPGVPEVSFASQCNLDPQTNQANLTLDISQSRYFPIGSTGDSNQSWNIPICLSLIGQAHSQQCFILEQQNEQKTFELEQCPTVIVPNKDAAGYYRYSLNDQTWQELIDHLDKLNHLERISLMSNLLASVKAGKSQADLVIKSAAAFAQLDDFESQFLPIGSLDLLADRFASAEEKQRMVIYLKSLYGSAIQQLGFEANTKLDETDPALAAMTRSKLIKLFALKLKDKELRAALVEKAIRYTGFESNQMIDEKAINPELVPTALSVAVQDQGVPFYEHLESLLNSSEDGTIRQNLLTGMSAATTKALSERVLDLIISTDTRLNEKGIMIFGQLNMPQTRLSAYQWFKDNYSLMALVLPEQYLAYMPYIGSNFCNPHELSDLQEFFADEIEPGSAGERHMALVTEMITNCAALKSSIKSLDIPTELSAQ